MSDFYNPFGRRGRHGPPRLCWAPHYQNWEQDLFKSRKEHFDSDLRRFAEEKKRNPHFNLKWSLGMLLCSSTFLDHVAFTLHHFHIMYPRVMEVVGGENERMVRDEFFHVLRGCFEEIPRLVQRERFLRNIYLVIKGIENLYSCDFLHFQYVRKPSDLYVPNGHWIRRFLTTVQGRLPDFEIVRMELETTSTTAMRTASYHAKAFADYRKAISHTGETNEQRYYRTEDLRYGECAGPEPFCDDFEHREGALSHARETSFKSSCHYNDCLWTIDRISSTLPRTAPRSDGTAGSAGAGGAAGGH